MDKNAFKEFWDWAVEDMAVMFVLMIVLCGIVLAWGSVVLYLVITGKELAALALFVGAPAVFVYAKWKMR